MTRNVRTIAKAPETHRFPVSTLEALIVVAIYVAGLIISLMMH